MATVVVAFAVTPPMVAELGDAAFGVWSLGASLLGYAALLDLGIGAAVMVHVATALPTDDLPRARAAVRLGSSLYVLIGAGLIAVVAAMGRWLLAGLRVPHDLRSSSLLLLLALSGAWTAQRLAATSATVLDVERRFTLSQTVPMLGQAATWAAAYLVVSVMGVGVGGAGVAVLAVQVMVVLLVAVPALGRLRGGPTAPISTLDLRAAGGFTAALQVATVADVINFSTDRVVIAAMLGVQQVTPYELANRVAALSRTIVLVPLPLLFPMLATLSHQRRRLGAERAGRLVTALTGAVTACTYAAAEPLVEMWLGGPQPQIVWLIRGLVVAYGVHATTGVYTTAMKAAGRFWPAARFALAAAGLNILLTVGLTPRYGLPGVVGATVLGLLLPSLWFLGVGARQLRLGAGPLRAFGWTAAATVFAAASGSWVAHVEVAALLRLVLSILTAAGTFLAAAAVLKLATRDDLRWV